MHFSPSFQHVPPAPHVLAQLFADYQRITKGMTISFRDYLRIIGFLDPADQLAGTDSGRATAMKDMALVSVPRQPITGTLRLIVLLVDFPDKPGQRPAHEYEDMLFSEGTFLTGSMRDFYREVSYGQVDVVGDVYGWLRMPQPYDYYVNDASGVGRYPRNAQRLAEHALEAALSERVPFPAALDKLGKGSITGLFIVHAGRGAEVFPSVPLQKRAIWSHKADMATPVEVSSDLFATNYLTVPEDCRMGVCAHELGHLAFQWDDFYDPNYDKDGHEWAGAGKWDLMAGGSWNGDGNVPAHPAGLHKSQHGWGEHHVITKTTRGLVIPPSDANHGVIVSVRSTAFSDTQRLVLENRQRRGFDVRLPGEGLLVWRVDTDLEMTDAIAPAMLLVQADGLHDLESPDDFRGGDASDPFPGTANILALEDFGDISTSFPGAARSGIRLSNIKLDPATGEIQLDVELSDHA